MVMTCNKGENWPANMFTVHNIRLEWPATQLGNPSLLLDVAVLCHEVRWTFLTHSKLNLMLSLLLNLVLPIQYRLFLCQHWSTSISLPFLLTSLLVLFAFRFFSRVSRIVFKFRESFRKTLILFMCWQFLSVLILLIFSLTVRQIFSCHFWPTLEVPVGKHCLKPSAVDLTRKLSIRNNQGTNG